jgi:hypothetical protein
MSRISVRAGPFAVADPAIGRHQGQRLARAENSEVGFWERVLRFIGHLLRATGSILPHGPFGLVVLALVLVVVVIVVLTWVRPKRSARARDAAVLASQDKTSRDYRQAAAQYAAEGAYGRAIVEGVRAIAAELDERAILPPRPGRTADELAAEAGRELPGLAAELRAVTRLFDDVLYGERAGTEAGYRQVSRVDAEVRAAKVIPGSGSAPLAGVAVPR